MCFYGEFIIFLSYDLYNNLRKCDFNMTYFCLVYNAMVSFLVHTKCWGMKGQYLVCGGLRVKWFNAWEICCALIIVVVFTAHVLFPIATLNLKFELTHWCLKKNDFRVFWLLKTWRKTQNKSAHFLRSILFSFFLIKNNLIRNRLL